ncbi:hypothetical protein CEXT_368091, partial [Caerostris extrusa]
IHLISIVRRKIDKFVMSQDRIHFPPEKFQSLLKNRKVG